MNLVGRVVPGTSAEYRSLPAADRDLIGRIRERNLTYLPAVKLASVARTCRDIESRGVPGVFVEAGCALGGSSILIASTKAKGRKYFVYDVFGMIPPPTQEDTPDVHARYKTIVEGKATGIGSDKYYGYEDDLYETVRGNLRSFGVDLESQSVFLIKGLLQDTMTVTEPVAFAHVDVDWYDPVMTCLQRLFPRLSAGGSIILDDYHDWGGCRKATDEYLRTVVGQFVTDDRAGSLKITKTASPQ